MQPTVRSPRRLPLHTVGHRRLPNSLTCGTAVLNLVWNKPLGFSSMFLLSPLLQQCLDSPIPPFLSLPVFANTFFTTGFYTSTY